jgi:hypothetical protein
MQGLVDSGTLLTAQARPIAALYPPLQARHTCSAIVRYPTPETRGTAPGGLLDGGHRPLFTIQANRLQAALFLRLAGNGARLATTL